MYTSFKTSNCSIESSCENKKLLIPMVKIINSMLIHFSFLNKVYSVFVKHEIFLSTNTLLVHFYENNFLSNFKLVP